MQRSILRAKLPFPAERAYESMNEAFDEQNYQEAFNLAMRLIGPEEELFGLDSL